MRENFQKNSSVENFVLASFFHVLCKYSLRNSIEHILYNSCYLFLCKQMDYFWNLDPNPEKPEPRNTWTLKNPNPESQMNKGSKNLSDVRDLFFIKTMRNVICSLKVRLLRYQSKFFRLKFVLKITQLLLKILSSVKFLNIRSSHLEVFCKKGVFKKFAKLIEKYFLYFNKISDESLSTLLKRDFSICASLGIS